jgi:hypothetical protein
MNRRRRNGVHLTRHALRYKASKWLKLNKNVAFNNPILTEVVGLDPFSRIDTSRVYQDVIVYWRKKFIDYYYKQKEAGLLDNLDSNTAWDILILNYNQNDSYVFLYDRKLGYYIQPSFDELEKIDKKRLEHQWKGICTVINEMQLFNARLLTNGIQKPVGELIEAGKSFDNLLTKSKSEL